MKKQSQQSNQKIKVCKVCFKQIENELTIQNVMKKDLCLCHDCLLKMRPVFNEFKIGEIKCLNIYEYNEKIREILYQFKGCKDYELKDVFLNYFSDYLNLKFNNYIVIPAPSFELADQERGFNHVEEIFSCLKLKMLCCVHKIKNVKQADMTSQERQKISEYLTIDNVDLSHKKVLIVDDVLTTGSTIKAILGLVKKKNPKSIKVLVMSKTIDLDER